jgi:hypothetical protein
MRESSPNQDLKGNINLIRNYTPVLKLLFNIIRNFKQDNPYLKKICFISNQRLKIIMTDSESNIKHLIQEYLLDEGLLRSKIPLDNNKLQFGFQFVFPKGPLAQKMVVIKPKNKDLIVISNPIQIAPQHVKALNSL